jgi:hypothetical protein
MTRRPADFPLGPRRDDLETVAVGVGDPAKVVVDRITLGPDPVTLAISLSFFSELLTIKANKQQ